MSSADEALFAHVVACVRELPQRTLDDLVASLRAAADWSSGLRAEPSTRDPSWSSLRREAIRGGSAPPRIADLLGVARAMESMGTGRSACEVAWTGPTPPLSPLRRTEQALLEVIGSARRELWLVSFAAYRIQSVVDALVAAAQRGCKVRLLLESPEESEGLLSSGGTRAVPPEVSDRCEVYVWPRALRPSDEGGRPGLLHAKCAVADDEVLFVGSANLTAAAFERNLELGVIVHASSVARAVSDQLAWLISHGTLLRR